MKDYGNLNEHERKLIRWFVKEHCEGFTQKDFDEEFIWWVEKAFKSVPDGEKLEFIEEFKEYKRNYEK